MSKVQRQRPVTNAVSLAAAQVKDKDLGEIYSRLSPQQLLAARLECTGVSDTNKIAETVGVSHATVSQWRSDPDYKKIVTINLKIIDFVTSKWRIDRARQILVPAYMELANRLGDKEKIERMDTRLLMDVLTKFAKEIRLETRMATDTDPNSELSDLQKRRNFIAAEQAMAVEELKKNSNIIEFPHQKAANM